MSEDTTETVGSNVGEATTATKLKKLWKADKAGLSLKQFARRLLKTGDKLAKDWFAHKKGSLNMERSKDNIRISADCRVATKRSRAERSNKNKGKKKDTADTAVAAKK